MLLMDGFLVGFFKNFIDTDVLEYTVYIFFNCGTIVLDRCTIIIIIIVYCLFVY